MQYVWILCCCIQRARTTLSMHTVIIVSKPQAERTPRLGAAGCHNPSLPSKIRGMLLLQRAPSSMRSAVLPILALLGVLGASAASSSGIAPPRADRSSRRMGPLGRNRHVTASDPPGHGASPCGGRRQWKHGSGRFVSGRSRTKETKPSRWGSACIHQHFSRMCRTRVKRPSNGNRA